MLYIKVTPDEHRFACSDGCIYGLVNGNKDIYAYAELGDEDLDYIPKTKEDLREDRKRFTRCTVWFATTEERLEQGLFESPLYLGRVEIYKQDL